ncbi:MAG: hypothetical protein OEV49_17225 [candidate division Zixibacteria bacterium]|nr:hypothetical protein [candidate division Zixibacteria bacterium]MDH3937486.1 hypothetical protein [candidate division Zixibacteria bacterium]MDH4034743.1 hypothetical protein [candidate division Zixibacteria bacterium]
MSQPLLSSIYVKVLFGAVFGFIAVVGGMLVGNAILNRDAETRPLFDQSPIESELDEQYVTFTDGDLFPLEDYVDRDGVPGNFEQLLGGRPALLLFVSYDCEPCLVLLRAFKKNFADKVRPEVQVIVCLRDDRGPPPAEFEGLFEGFELAYYQGEYWQKTYFMGFWPTIIGVDGSGFVHSIQFGYESYIDIELAKFFFVSNQ